MTNILPAQVCQQSWLFFDLGNTVVDTKTNDYLPMFYLRDVAVPKADGSYFADAALYANSRDYLVALQAAEYSMGMLIDVPERWGVTEAEKISTLMDFIGGLVPAEATWSDSLPMDWSFFGAGRTASELTQGQLIIPLSTAERKDEGSLVVFEKAVRLAAEHGCSAVYQGESEAEMRSAQAAGMIPFHIGRTSAEYFYLPIEKIEAYVRNYVPDQWQRGTRL